MKIVDHTPFVSENGEISPMDRVKATMKYGLSWMAEVKAQQAVIGRLEKALERGFTLIRNHRLEQADVTLPLVLVGPPGVFVIYATELRGVYRAKGDTWGIVDGTRFTPARVNLLTRTAGLARALQVYLERQGLSNFGEVEPVIMAADPGLHVEAIRPIARVVLNDAIERFAASLMQARPAMTLEVVHEVVERIQRPLPPKSRQPAAPPEEKPIPAHPPAEPAIPVYQPMGQEMPFAEQSATNAAPFDTSELGFAFAEEPAAAPPLPPPPPPAVMKRSAVKRRLFSPLQLAVLGGMFLAVLCLFGALVYFIFFLG